MTDEADGTTADTMRERADESRVKLWLLLGANRLLLAAVLTVSLFVSFVVGVAVLSPPFAQQVASGDVIETLFSTMITVIVTGTTLVVTIGQLVLTQENGPLGDQRKRMSNTMDVRDFTEELIGSPSPAEPAEFLSEILGVTAERAQNLREEVDDSRDDALREEVDAFVESVVGNAETVREQLDGAQFGSFDVVFAALDFNYSWKIFRVEQLANDYEDSVTERETELLGDLKTALSLFGPAREHVKTLYFQWALVDLSQLILYVAVPALAVSGIMVGVVDAGTFPGATLGVADIVLVTGGAFAVTLLPFMLFVSYVLRILTVAKRTLAIGPLILRDSQR
ncbi:hypothetical protein [Halorussus litoreus]|uniref:hypothetical protein n=1 Tax=Halorussus litoreus TaxID=1710536 RepID=UPI000E2227F4|nr:hypothetical protein [Halorussus litoreus]